jgi:hypothetical protein
MQIIKNWLAGNRNFTTGSAIYKVLGQSEKLKQLFEDGYTAFAQKSLETEIEKLATAPILAVIPDPAAKETVAMPADGDAVLKAIKAEWQTAYERMKLLCHQLDFHGTSNSEEAIAYRKPIAKEIKELEQLCITAWAKRDYYIEHGKLPFTEPKKAPKPENPLDIAYRINNCAKYIRRYRKSVKDEPTNSKHAMHLKRYETEYSNLTGKQYEEN